MSKQTLLILTQCSGKQTKAIFIKCKLFEFSETTISWIYNSSQATHWKELIKKKSEKFCFKKCKVHFTISHKPTFSSNRYTTKKSRQSSGTSSFNQEWQPNYVGQMACTLWDKTREHTYSRNSKDKSSDTY